MRILKGSSRLRGMRIFDSACACGARHFHRVLRVVPFATLWATRPQRRLDEKEAAAQERPYWQSKDLQKIVYTSRFVRVILAQGPC